MNLVNQHLILGALAADAASMGLHWIYDQQRLRDINADNPEFLAPNNDNYQGVTSFYAHGKKSIGDLSHYGEQCFVMLKALAQQNGHYHQATYQQYFQDHFGYGGDYIGYIDRPTKITLDNITQNEKLADKQLHTLNLGMSDDVKNALLTTITSALKKDSTLNPSQLKQQCADAKPVSEKILKKIIENLQPLFHLPGADDVQLPAIAKLPALIANASAQPDLDSAITSAVRTTNNNDTAVAYGHIASQMMLTAINTQDINQVIDAACQSAPPEILPKIEHALDNAQQSICDYTQSVGLSCNLEFGIPSVIHNLSQQLSYQQSIRQNILAGGDSCGRSILLGAILAAVHGLDGNDGLPTSWLTRLHHHTEIKQLMAQCQTT